MFSNPTFIFDNELADSILDLNPSFGTDTNSDLSSVVIACEQVKRAVAKLSAKAALGPDRIPAAILKNGGSFIINALMDIYQESMSLGRVPHQWKEAFVTPIYKGGDKSKAPNYRPVSLTSH